MAAPAPIKRSYISRVVLAHDVQRMCGGISEIKLVPNINILAGPNGSGKSTILRVIRDKDWCSNMGCEVERVGERNLEFVAFDGELDNPRAMPGRGPLQFISHVGSHGEVQKRAYSFISERLQPGMLVLLDEPESALDIVGVKKLGALIISRTDLQWIVASHSPFIWGLQQHAGARLVELRPGYVQAALAQYKAMMG